MGVLKMSKVLRGEMKFHCAFFHSPQLQQKYKEAGLSDMRYRWDLLHRTDINISDYYKHGLNDDHIDSALKDMMRTFEALDKTKEANHG